MGWINLNRYGVYSALSTNGVQKPKGYALT
jgi:hypothetical protein